jgi:hypothetical protein
MSKKGWILLAKILVNAGSMAFLGCFVGLSGLTQYANFARPHAADPTRGWISTIPWSSGAYGTPQERDRVYWFFNGGFYSFILIAAGEAVRIYKFNDYPNQRP